MNEGGRVPLDGSDHRLGMIVFVLAWERIEPGGGLASSL